jgi:hypothetical protein
MDDWEQLPLYDSEIGAFRFDDPDTSVEAAESVDATRLEAMVRDAVWARGELGATNSELVGILGIAWNTVSPRCAPLKRKGFICDSGERRPGPSGRMQIVWKAPRWVDAVAVLVAADPPQRPSEVEAMVSL